jgi:molecular chaperone GrpE (heat shock protein)
MTLDELQREIAALPAWNRDEEAGVSSSPATTPLQIVSKQGRLLLRLSAATEAMEARSREMTEELTELRARADQEARNQAAREATALQKEREGERRTRQIALELIRLLDTLDWACQTLGAANGKSATGGTKRGAGNEATAERDMVQNVVQTGLEGAKRDSLRRLAALGITEIGCDGPPDGRLHESVDTTESATLPPYHIVSVVRRGYQWGSDVLRRAEVITVRAAEAEK